MNTQSASERAKARTRKSKGTSGGGQFAVEPRSEATGIELDERNGQHDHQQVRRVIELDLAASLAASSSDRPVGIPRRPWNRKDWRPYIPRDVHDLDYDDDGEAFTLSWSIEGEDWSYELSAPSRGPVEDFVFTRFDADSGGREEAVTREYGRYKVTSFSDALASDALPIEMFRGGASPGFTRGTIAHARDLAQGEILRQEQSAPGLSEEHEVLLVPLHRSDGGNWDFTEPGRGRGDYRVITGADGRVVGESLERADRFFRACRALEIDDAQTARRLEDWWAKASKPAREPEVHLPAYDGSPYATPLHMALGEVSDHFDIGQERAERIDGEPTWSFVLTPDANPHDSPWRHREVRDEDFESLRWSVRQLAGKDAVVESIDDGTTYRLLVPATGMGREHTTTWRRGLKATEAYDRQQLAYDLTGHRRGRFRDAADIPALHDWDDQD